MARAHIVILLCTTCTSGFCHTALNDLFVFVWEETAVMTLVLEPSSSTLSWFVRSDLTLGQETCFWRPLSISRAVIRQPARRCRPRGLTRASHVSSVTEASARSPFLTPPLSVVPRSTPRGTFCWQPWRSTTRWEGMRSQPPWARLTTLPPWCSTTQVSSTGSRV